MRTTDQLNALQGHITEHVPVSGVATRLWLARVTAVNDNSTVDVTPPQLRATKRQAPHPWWYAPKVGDLVFVADINGDTQNPYVIAPFTGTVIASSDGDG